MAKPYKEAHDLLVAGIGSASDYHADWQTIANDFDKLVVATGFDPRGHKAPENIRAKVAIGASEATVLRSGAQAPATASGDEGSAGKKRVLALKTLRHLHYFESFGKQRIWILSLPGKLRDFPTAYAGSSQTTIDKVLNTDSEKFDASAMGNLSAAAQLGLAWVHKALIVAGAPLEHENRKLFRRWFVPPETADESKRITDLATEMRPHLQNIATGLKTGRVILTDAPDERGTGSRAEKAEAFVKTRDDLMVVYVEQAFFSTSGNTLTGKTNWARILVHELTHSYARTKDHAYSWQGLLPRDADLLKKGIDARISANPQWAAVRTLSMDQCKENADTWAFFIADCAGALTHRDRMQALGQRIYDFGGVEMEKPLAAKMKMRAGVP